jgi:hypothetical protein
LDLHITRVPGAMKTLHRPIMVGMPHEARERLDFRNRQPSKTNGNGTQAAPPGSCASIDEA